MIQPYIASCSENDCSEGTSECGSDSYRLCFEFHGGSFAAALQGASRIFMVHGFGLRGNDVTFESAARDFENRKRRRPRAGGDPCRMDSRLLGNDVTMGTLAETMARSAGASK